MTRPGAPCPVPGRRTDRPGGIPRGGAAGWALATDQVSRCGTERFWPRPASGRPPC